MSHRPRLAGDGKVLLPAEVSFDEAANGYRGDYSSEVSDPFDWTSDKLLLAESLARLDLSDRESTRRWLLEHGFVASLAGLGMVIEVDPRATGTSAPLADRWLREPLDDLIAEQDAIRCLLLTLTRLSDHRDDDAWEPAWGQVIVDGAAEGLIIGGPYAGRLVGPASQTAAWHRQQAETDPDRVSFHLEQAELQDATQGWLRAVLLNPDWHDVQLRSADRNSSVAEEIMQRAGELGTTWDQTVELVRLLIEPRVERAAERRFVSIRVPREDGRRVLEPQEARIWRSVEPPIYLQIYEALRRVTEGEPGATICRECGLPFLVLDARRRFFCNDRERFRHAQRERRKHLASMEGTLAPVGTLECKVIRGSRKRTP